MIRSSWFFTSPVSEEDLQRFKDGQEPYLFQELVEKTYDIRVTVIGAHCFATRIDSQVQDASKVDWRRSGGGLGHSAETLPEKLAVLCRDLVAGYGLRFGAIDLARTTTGGYVFFELNPNGQWAWIEQLTGVPLRSHLADLLLAPC